MPTRPPEPHPARFALKPAATVFVPQSVRALDVAKRDLREFAEVVKEVGHCWRRGTPWARHPPRHIATCRIRVISWRLARRRLSMARETTRTTWTSSTPTRAGRGRGRSSPSERSATMRQEAPGPPSRKGWRRRALRRGRWWRSPRTRERWSRAFARSRAWRSYAAHCSPLGARRRRGAALRVALRLGAPTHSRLRASPGAQGNPCAGVAGRGQRSSIAARSRTLARHSRRPPPRYAEQPQHLPLPLRGGAGLRGEWQRRRVAGHGVELHADPPPPWIQAWARSFDLSAARDNAAALLDESPEILNAFHSLGAWSRGPALWGWPLPSPPPSPPPCGSP